MEARHDPSSSSSFTAPPISGEFIAVFGWHLRVCIGEMVPEG